MSGVYHVFMKYTRETDTLRADYGRHLLTFESRWAADELFRGLQSLKTAAGAKRFTTLTRVSPQFWCYDTVAGDPWWTIVYVQRENALPAFNYKFMSVILADAAVGRDWPILCNPTIGTDWVSGNTFYIRNRRLPGLFWYRSGGRLVLSTTRRSKFLITDSDVDDERVLIKTDNVTIMPVGYLNLPFGEYVYKNADGAKLSIGGTKQVWLFSDLFNSIGATWASETGFADGTQFAISAPKGGDEWEPC
ncbi:hypothetical protein L873DRAFT_572517 [Choiromyces venosus 120613-1]|uniref:Uncharacterized protein n=1 Tax=Choiromyces venosus 120613-1 TaxID=1336337 RepID=A0A3N4K0S3_9PEZI|nr:hypothetical protein L873DRAFT_572517 [Choiromyces venosus 120613-1]